MFQIKPPYYGAAYYPEAWEPDQVDEDIRLMLEMGINTVRIGEFAWSNMEPAEGDFDFSLMNMVIDKCFNAGIAVIMCTPTCTPPAWMTTKYSEIMVMNTHGERATHGGRRNACANSHKYREFCDQIVTRMAMEFANKENIIAWQVDNELYNNSAEGRGCCCPECMTKFKQVMKLKYVTIENLNKAWDNYVWSLEYNDFDQLPIPRHDVWHHPSYQLEWMEVQAKSYCEFSNFQADILHKYVNVPVGTDMMPFLGLDYEDMNEKLDVIQFNHYRDSSNLWDIAFWSDFLRNLKPVPFWVTETASCWGGGIAPSWHGEPNFGIANVWLPITLGAEANLYWLWRNHWGGQELMHGSLVNSWGRPMHIAGEIKQLSAGLKKAADMINGTKPINNHLAMHFSHLAWNMYQFQPMVNGFDFNARVTNDIYHPLQQIQLRPNVLGGGHALDDYKMIITAFMPCIEEKGLSDRIFNWVENGGTWVIGPMADIRTTTGAKYKQAPFGFLEKWTDVHYNFTIPGGKMFPITYANGDKVDTTSLNYDAYTVTGASKVLASYTDEYLDGYAAITETKIGNKGGRIIMVGTLLAPKSWASFIKNIAAECEIMPVTEASGNVVTGLRDGEFGEVFTAVEVENKEGEFVVPFDAYDILTDMTYQKGQKVNMTKFGVFLMKKK